MAIDPARKFTATFATSRGNVVCELFARDAPNTVNNFVFLAKETFYDGTVFHRVGSSSTLRSSSRDENAPSLAKR